MLLPGTRAVNRRAFISAAVASGAAAVAFGLFANVASAAPTPHAQPHRSSSTLVGRDVVHESRAARTTTAATFGALKQIDAGVLNVGYAEAGPADGPPVILLHGWPYDIHSFVDVAPLLAAEGYRVIVP
jgi:hypothetical protein